MKRAIRLLIALTVAVTLVSGAFAGSAAANNTIDDTDLVDVEVNAGNPTTAVAANGANFGGSQNAVAIAQSNQDAGDDFTQNDNDIADIG